MIKLEMSENDIVKSIRNTIKSPIHRLVARYFHHCINDIDINKDSILVWDYETNDYISYRYCLEDIVKVNQFIDEWQDFTTGHLDDFTLDPISFCVYGCD